MVTAAVLVVAGLAGVSATAWGASHRRSSVSLHARVAGGGQPWENSDQPALVRADELLSAMTTDQKIDLVLGNFVSLQIRVSASRC